MWTYIGPLGVNAYKASAVPVLLLFYIISNDHSNFHMATAYNTLANTVRLLPDLSISVELPGLALVDLIVYSISGSSSQNVPAIPYSFSLCVYPCFNNKNITR